jgi:G protein-coupled receptor Mth (Methuselah protein)
LDSPETVNITGGFSDEKTKNILFDGDSYPPKSYAIYNYILNGTSRVSVESHTRGCVCQVRPCFKICCPPGYVYQPDKGDCVQNENADVELEFEIVDAEKSRYHFILSDLLYRCPVDIFALSQNWNWTLFKVL